MNKEIKYISFYNDEELILNEKRNTSIPLKNKVDYVAKTIASLGYSVEIISPCWSNEKKGFYKGASYKVDERITLRNFNTFGSRTKLGAKLKKIYAAIQLTHYLLFNTRKNDQIIVYHSLALIFPIRAIRLIRNLDVILEVEELYSQVWKGSYNNKKEINYINSFDKHIFASNVLAEKINSENSIVLYGAYIEIQSIKKKQNKREYIELVYAGSIDRTKGGAKIAVETMRYLPGSYRLHVLGFGNSEDVKDLIELIELINTEKEFKSCRFHGSLKGLEYEKFLLNCDIGLNSQNEGDYMLSAFPSKILSYLSHGLNIVSTNIESIKSSRVNNLITFSKNDTPIEVAKAVLSVNISESKEKRLQAVKELKNNFVLELSELLD